MKFQLLKTNSIYSIFFRKRKAVLLNIISVFSLYSITFTHRKKKFYNDDIRNTLSFFFFSFKFCLYN